MKDTALKFPPDIHKITKITLEKKALFKVSSINREDFTTFDTVSILLGRFVTN